MYSGRNVNTVKWDKISSVLCKDTGSCLHTLFFSQYINTQLLGKNILVKSTLNKTAWLIIS